MYRFSLKLYILLSIIIVPLLTFFGIPWLNIFGVSPCWIVLWLLPWSLKQGEVSAVFAGLFFGLLLDSFTTEIASQAPILMFLGFWWGRLGARRNQINSSFALGWLAWLGTFFFGLSNWIQTILQSAEFSFNLWAIQTLLAEAFITSLLAPIICSWLLWFWRPRSFL